MNKPVLILGGSTGMGAACARLLSKRGHTVILVARNEQALRQTQASLSGEAMVFPYDLEDTEHVKTVFDFCREQGALLHAMIYCAGMDASYPIKACTASVMERVMRVNCFSFMEAGKHFSNKRYSVDYGKIVAISSSASITCDKGMGIYSASKAALNATVKTMAKEFTRRGILVNAVLPAGVLTPMAIKKMQMQDTGLQIKEEEAIEALNQNQPVIVSDSDQPLGIISPDSVAELITFLVSEQNKYITGALIPVSAGRYL
ncbi:MAG: SDR family oxidoreductase [Lachnospiraceae bacterium]|nr:SDR family oxidoreductase [Lachnospiraceae bacterium]